MRIAKTSTFFAVVIFLFTEVYSCAPPVRQVGTQAIGQVPANVLSTQGQSLYNNGKHDEALPILQKWVLVEPNNWLSHNWLGWNYYNLKRYNEAIAELQKANAIKSDKSNFEGLGRCYYDQGAHNEAIGYFRMWVELDTANWAAHNWLGWTHLMLKQYNEAIAELQKANAIKSGISNFRGLGSCYYALEEYDKAIRALEEGLAIASDTTKGVLEFEMALCYIAKKDYPKAAMLLKGKGFLGIGMQKHEKGFEIQSVFKNGPADLAGLRIGDILTEFKGKPLAKMDMEKFLKDVSQNSGEASVKLLRQDTLRAATVVMDIMRLGETKIAEKTDFKPLGTEIIRGEKWAVIVGVSNYKDSRIPSLRYASKDATSLYK